MSTKTEKLINLPRIVSRGEWQQARHQLLAKEKAATRAHDALAAERRRLPMVRIEKDYVFDGPSGKTHLLELFEGRRQLIIYHFMFAPGVDGWPSAGCPGCSLVVDYIDPLAHLHARDTSLALVSRAPIANLEAYKRRMGWNVPWYSSAENDFNDDFGLTTDEGETFGLSAFLRDGEVVFHTYFTTDRALEAIASNFTLLDWTVLGRQEEWENSPAGWPQSAPYVWWRRHDEYK
jgi:predicted dithiol-disulfide oxidoreductase (DUF899 family)